MTENTEEYASGILRQAVAALNDPYTGKGGKTRLAKSLQVSRQVISKWGDHPDKMPTARVDEISDKLPVFQRYRNNFPI